MNKTFLIIIALLVLAGVIYLAIDTSETEDVMNGNDSTIIEKGENMSDDSMMEEDTEDSMSMEEDEMMAEAGTYTTYSEDKLAWAEDGDVVLFFKADWCPVCRALDSDIKDSLNDIPADVAILNVDYDDSVALRQKYGVTTQHTFVQVDAQGEVITKWIGSQDLESLLSEIQ